MLRVLGVLPLLWLPVLTLMAQSGGRQVYDFLLLPANAQVAAVGGRTVSLMGRDPGLAWHNPALLADTLTRCPSLQVVNYLSDISYGNLAYANRLGRIGYWHAGVHYINYGSLTRTDIFGNIRGSFGANEVALYGGVGRHFGRFRFGSTAKIVLSNLAGLSSTGLALDFGGLYVDARHGLSIGAVLRNVGIQLSTYEANGLRESLPLLLEVGLSHRLRRAPLRYHITLGNLETAQVASTNGEKVNLINNIARRLTVGVELFAGRYVTVRLGYSAQRRAELATQGQAFGLAGFAMGFGLQTARLGWHYAYANYHAAGGSHHFGLAYRLRQR